jgi:hypothetical protein
MDMAGVGGLSPPMLADHEAGGFIWNLTMGSIKYAKLLTRPLKTKACELLW